VSWDELERPTVAAVTVDGVELRAGSRVVLRPAPGGDILDLALADRVAIVEAIEQELDGRVHLAVTLEDDPGRDLGEAHFLGHRFFFPVEEVEPLHEPRPESAPRGLRVLVAGVGNVFLGDDGFGVALAGRLAGRPLPPGVDVVDFGIRGMDLVYALQRGYDVAVFLDATPRGEPAGTLSVIEVDPGEGDATLDTHDMHPSKVLGFARALGPVPPRILVLGCEPAVLVDQASEEVLVQLSPPVEGALGEATRLVESLLQELTTTQETEVPPS
jgi:hydrogenase maturation protease